MQINECFLICLFFIFSSHMFAQNLLNNPESVVYDSVRRYYLVSNKGNGQIIKIDSLGNQSVWNSNQSSIRGMHILNNHLYVCCNAGVAGFNLANATRINIIAIADRNFLNDITSDSNGYLYASDSGNGKIYKLNPNNQTYSTFVDGLSSPNGMIHDQGNNQLIVCHWGPNATIKAVNLPDSSVSLLTLTTLSDLDGLAEDSQGSIFVSSWSANSIYKYDQNFNIGPILVSDGHNGPADIFYDRFNDILAIPNFNSNTVDFIPIIPNSIIEDNYSIPQSIILSQNHPNPFNPKTKITYSLFKSANTKIYIFNSLGQKVKVLIDKEQTAGTYEIIWNATDDFGNIVSAGTYFYQIQNGDKLQTRRLILLK